MMTEQPVQEEDAGKGVGLYTLIAIGVGDVLGAAIFTILGHAAGIAGPSIIISFVIGGVLTILAGLSFSELASTFPASGGGYTFAKKAYGGMVAFLTGWLLAFANIIFGAIASLGCAQIIAHVTGIPYIMQIPIALFFLLFFTLLNFRGIEESGRAEIILVVFLLGGFAIFTAASAFFMSSSNLEPFMPSGWPGIIQATSFTFISYFGFETIANVSGEATEPAKDLTKATLISTLICTLVFVPVAWVAIGVVGSGTLSEAVSPIMLVGENALGVGGLAMAGVIGTVATLTSLNASIIASSMILFALARDGFFPEEIAETNDKGVPLKAIATATIIMGIFISTGVVEYIAHVADFNLFLGVFLVTVSLLLLRRKRATLERAFETPKIVAPLSAVSLIVFMLFLDNAAIATGVAIVFIGVIVYLMKIAPRYHRSLTIGGITGAAGYSLLAVIWIGNGSLVWTPGSSAIDLAPPLILGAITLLISSVLCAYPLSSLVERGESIEPTFPHIERLKILENIVAVITIVCGVFALVVFYTVFHGGLTFPNLTDTAGGYRFLLLLGLLGYAISAIVAGLFLWNRKYAKAV
ncbi:MAG: APC family permease [Candidatus Thorarchaeota archaeon]